MMMLPRPAALEEIAALHRIVPAVALLGPRQCGKTTLARMFAEAQPAGTTVTVFDLERSADSRRLQLPERTLGPLSGLVVLDEVQRLPSLFTALRPLIDRPEAKTLEHARALSRSDLERGGVRAGDRQRAGGRPPIPRHPLGIVRGASARAVA